MDRPPVGPTLGQTERTQVFGPFHTFGNDPEHTNSWNTLPPNPCGGPGLEMTGSPNSTQTMPYFHDKRGNIGNTTYYMNPMAGGPIWSLHF